ncbi:MAG TPA: UDP-N-acetylmuramoyl-tripeptide--D-alanyl-D-alanine ligase [Algoriphagus sp.]|jgi:UDP-N-acetylmuramoyl-tripeptide--D-alanyl-D-alanine ligase|uniref:UDP-N-acetylmuramoyl-tripeptide--D-alanyl-D- alanine ligase n=1 Tax=unclassified Algoriphagus TaxID=2641541 RepID=UPI000C4530D6|nr:MULTISPECIES: UDP-N-acetylmuramoyl-tripeptide--D-alanyl-D-alanine ligase [unclassified Algoriphagus]MAL13097.1 UDP-N-acetylmuramoyl-tripeptide--D-alanyl-D-alanine ligase [Algoriphagus sp.]QYH41036.1 UDP-N-acetylmuramoyl-tripeptide--D-alanyl-D-alanine ligase [Algoriphagus sp. NBT04N3]HAD51486.1 UDP-N-acetylmuramoyl-tripeptide--D-alanyl-D-alanine ligase [Algoriphagus sp.]HAS58595.1 UDP-N-acetylmuramoyl-tripeptide--D-alanyl-D-alanine ligase [Algoriphagus sp.]HCD86057.1 UDP-N-acetylmuramoyl-tri|tara:strand:+ start:429 stop:1724 length:1296 start_codon:yes stop_codon:yes gene_type:complete
MNIAILYQLFLKSTGVSTDTRKIDPGNIFFALKGPNFNANEFASKALEMGASAVVIDEAAYFEEDDERYFICENALVCLQKLANYHRHQFDIPVIGLTGSNGKTTSKELLNAVLRTKFKTLATVGNLNNHIGVPLTLLALNQSHELAIVEMGANKQGDIQELCEIAEPTHGFITNIGKAHLEGMGGPEGVLKTKTELYQHLRENKGTVFINSQDPILSNMIKRFEEPVLYPAKGDFCEVSFHGADPFVKFSVEGNQEIFLSSLIGAYNFGNIATALTVGKFFGVDMNQAVQAIVDYKPSNMRSQLVEKRSNLIILDAYNANPSSMEAAIRTFGTMQGKKHKMIILGDMFELGEHAEEEHRKLGEIVSEYEIDKVCFTGKLVVSALEKAPKALYFPDPFSFRNWLQDSQLEDYLILIKGSRGMKLEGLVEFI